MAGTSSGVRDSWRNHWSALEKKKIWVYTFLCTICVYALVFGKRNRFLVSREGYMYVANVWQLFVSYSIQHYLKAPNIKSGPHFLAHLVWHGSRWPLSSVAVVHSQFMNNAIPLRLFISLWSNLVVSSHYFNPLPSKYSLQYFVKWIPQSAIELQNSLTSFSDVQ